MYFDYSDKIKMNVFIYLKLIDCEVLKLWSLTLAKRLIDWLFCSFHPYFIEFLFLEKCKFLRNLSNRGHKLITVLYIILLYIITELYLASLNIVNNNSNNNDS